MKRIIKITALLLTLALLLPGGFAAAAESKYVALGDSISAGFGVEKGQGYAELLCEVLKQETAYKNLTFSNLSNSGDDSSDMLKVIEANKDTIKGATLVTISIGGNNFLGKVINALTTYVTTKIDISSIDLSKLDMSKLDMSNPDLSMFGITDSFFDDLAAYLASPTVTAAIDEGIKKLPGDIDSAIKAIKKLAPNAKIYFSTVYNPISSGEKDLYKVADKMITQVNTHITDRAKTNGYTVVDVYKAYREYDGKSLSNIDLNSLGFDPHPNAAGHKLIATVHYTAITGKSATEAKFPSGVKAYGLTRGEAVAGIIEALYSKHLMAVGQIAAAAGTPEAFGDVKSTHPLYAQIMSARSLGLIKGVGKSNFNPEAPMTRQDYAVLLSRLFELMTKNKLIDESVIPSIKGATYADMNETAGYALTYMKKYTGTSLLPAKDGKADPKGQVTSTELAVVKALIAK